MSRRYRIAVGAAMLASGLAVASCGGDGVRDSTMGMMPDPTVDFQTIQDTIFTPTCALADLGCHAGPFPQQGLDLSEGRAYDFLVGIPSVELAGFLRVDPGNPMDSYLFMKVTGDPRIVFDQMPLVGGPLSQNEIDLIMTWIAEGAER